MRNLFFLTAIFFVLSACSDTSSTGNEKGNQEQTTQQDETADEATTEEEVATNDAPEKSEASQETTCDPIEMEAYLDDPDESGTNIRSSPGGKVVMTLKKDDQNPEYMFTVTESSKGWFKIKGPIGGGDADIEVPGDEAWIHGSVIAVSTRNYGGQELSLLDQPEGGKTVGAIKAEAYGLKLKDLCGAWTQVDYQGTIGWIETEWLCGNPFTTCP